MKAKPPNRWQSMPARFTKVGRPLNPGHTKARQAMRADKCVFWAVILGSLTVALFGA